MAERARDHSGIWDSPEPLDRVEEALAVLGDGIRHLHPRLWRSRMLFAGAPDHELRAFSGTFPATFRPDHTSHPLFVLEAGGALGHRVCPCSTKDRGARRWIRAGCVLELTGTATDRRSYLVESCSFLFPQSAEFSRRLRFLGRVPPSCVESRTDAL